MATLCTAAPGAAETADVVIVGGTPGGIMAAIAAAREGCSVILLERTAHLGGLPANGLGATDIATRGATGGLFLEFVRRIKDHYVRAYGADSQQVKDCSDGYHFEPSVAGKVFADMLAGQPKVRVLRMRQFDALAENVRVEGGRLREVRVLSRDSRAAETYAAGVFIDATYEGDLAAAAGVPFRLGREAAAEFNEPMAGKIYKLWGGAVGPGSTGEGDRAIQAYNFRLPLTRDPARRVAIAKPANFRREDYASLVDDIRENRETTAPGYRHYEREWNGIGRVVNMVKLPNGLADANNQHAAFLSTDLPEENWPWPTASWEWRDRFAARLRDYTLGLLWFVQNDPELPEDFRARCAAWGLAKDEYADNGNFPRQVYVREGRRIEGEHLFTAHDALPVKARERPPVHGTSITASHYALDSHAVRKREPGRVHLDGFFSHPTAPYTVPYGVMVPKKVDGLLTPVPVSGTHVGFSTLRMEPCWMALGEAAGTAAAVCLRDGVALRRADVAKVQDALLRHGAVLIYFQDVKADHPAWPALQRAGLKGLVKGWQAQLDRPVTAGRAKELADALGRPAPPIEEGKATLGQVLAALSGA
ncbi:MAG: FAD-dependent oxidoreductase [Planctomycetes bacterium]|nr:FAD-dependent oxidoreductase [Planctomycetota bacterium]